MWKWANQVLKRRTPFIHAAAKRLAKPWLQGGRELRVPKRVAGRLVWTQLRLLTADPPEQHVLRWVINSLPRGGTFFDVGAHYGWISIAAAHRLGSAGTVVAFEPSPVLVDILAYHKRANRLKQMQIIQAAVSNRESVYEPFFLLNDGMSSRNSLTIGAKNVPHIDPDGKTLTRVRSVTLDGFVSSSGIVPDLIKIDVEGAELLVLQGAERLLASHHPVLIVGVHPFWLPASQTVEQILRFLVRLDYEVRDAHKIDFENSYLADYLCTHRSVADQRRTRQ